MEAWQPLRDVGAGRTATVVIVTFVAVLIAAGCRPEKPPVVVTAGDIAVCAREGDEATAKLVEGIDGATGLSLGDKGYPDGAAEECEEGEGRAGGEFKERTKPGPGNH